MPLGDFLHGFKEWIRSESDLFSGKFQANPYDMVSYKDHVRARLREYFHKIQVENYEFTACNDGTTVLRSRIVRTTHAQRSLSMLYDLYMSQLLEQGP